MAAPSSPDGPAECWNQRFSVGDASEDSGLKVELSSTPDITLPAGSSGNALRSSRFESAAPRASGAGAQENEMLNTPSTVESRPLTISMVSRYEIQACWARGVLRPIERRMIIAARHKRGSIKTNGDISKIAHIGTARRRRERSCGGPSG